MERLKNLDAICIWLRGIIGAIFVFLAGYLDTTKTFLYALVIVFFFNIVAGFRADEVRVEMKRLFPPLFKSANFRPNKFKTALFEFTMIIFAVYLLKVLIDLFHLHEHSTFIVQALMGVAVYFYTKNIIKNARNILPNSYFFKFLDIALSLKFKEIIPTAFADAIDEVEKKNKEKKGGEENDKN